jgi:catechol 2,3-dioxygenase-like lactoylglutathione lyase family enzyme
MSYTVGGIRSSQPFRIERLGHFGYHTPDLTGTMSFLSKELGLQISDVDDFTKRVPALPKEHATGYFVRCAHDHHTLVIGSQTLVDMREPGRRGALVNQLSWQVGSLKQVVDGVDFLGKNAKLRRIGRDAPGSNWHAYAYCPDGYVNEIFYGMEQIGWDGRSKPSSMYDRAFHSLPPLPQIPEYEEAGQVLARGQSLEGFRYEEGRPASFDVEGILMPQPFKLTRLARVLLFVADPEESLKFYLGVLGLKVSHRTDVLGHTCIFLRAGDEHHSLALMPAALKARLDFGAACSFSVATYQQLRDAHLYFESKRDRIIPVPSELSPGMSHGFWIRGPDAVAIQLVYGQARHSAQGPAPTPSGSWPETIEHAGGAWHEPVFMGPLA